MWMKLYVLDRRLSEGRKHSADIETRANVGNKMNGVIGKPYSTNIV